MPGDPETKEYVTSLRVYNSLSIALTFALEPWGEQYKLRARRNLLRSSREVQRETPRSGICH